jgi:glycosyltransferase involved in cell wall biosynthesis
MKPFVTVAICTFNRAALLETTFTSLLDLAPVPAEWELLVVDNASTDGTQAVCAAFAERLPMRVVYEPVAGLSNARNCALDAARGQHIVFTDDDVLFDRRWLSVFVETARRWPDAVAFGGPIAPYFPTAPDPDLLAAFPVLANGFCGIDHRRDEGPLPEPLQIFGANMAFRLEAVGGLRFDAKLGRTPTSLGGGEEIDFVSHARALGDVIWCPEMRLQHYVDPSRMTLGYLLKYHTDFGETRARQYGIRPAAAVLGAPQWLWRACIQSYLAYIVMRLLGSRRRALQQLRDHSYFRGMLRAARLA